MDGAGPFRRFWAITFPLLSPTLFFLMVMNVIYAFFETFGVIHTVTQGGPGGATTTQRLASESFVSSRTAKPSLPTNHETASS